MMKLCDINAASLNGLLKGATFRYLDVGTGASEDRDSFRKLSEFLELNAGPMLHTLKGGVVNVERSSANSSSILAGGSPPMLQTVLEFATRKGLDSVQVVAEFAETTSRLSEAASSHFNYSTSFDVISIHSEKFLTLDIIRKFHGSKIFLFDGIDMTYGGAAAFQEMFSDPQYRLLARSDELGAALFVHRALDQKLPVHFFTIVLNGEPFIRYHETMLRSLPFRWHWHIVEGVAQLVRDTGWSVAAGGHIPAELHRAGRSTDGTSSYIDEIARRFPDNVTVYRKPEHVFWDGKLEMVQAPLAQIHEACLLWQVDADELWSPQQVIATRAAFLAEPERTAAWFWCNYFVGPELAISTRNNYAQNPNQEWLRVWNFKPGMSWNAHEPPTLAYPADGETSPRDVGRENPFRHHETEAFGAVFDHFAYVLEAQLQFKEAYYGYTGAVERWHRLQRAGIDASAPSGFLRDYLPWVSDDAMFDRVDRLKLQPCATRDMASGDWTWNTEGSRASSERPRDKILVDGIFFQLNNTGIARLWRNLLLTWAKMDFAARIIVLDREGTAPRIERLTYRTIRKCDAGRMMEDARYLQWVCDQEGAALFISTYYTTPVRTRSVFFGYDMIPERLNPNSDDVWWRQKRIAIDSAVGHVMISDDSADELVHFHKQIERGKVLVAHCSVDPVFKPCLPQELSDFRSKYNIERDYVLLVGERSGWLGYKNGIAVFAALSLIPAHSRPLLICVGGQPSLSESERALLGEADVLFLALKDADLRCAYGGARAYICPSLYEGFGLPIVEAMAVGCLVLAARSSVIPEVGGEAAIYFNPSDPAELASLIRDCTGRQYVAQAQAGVAQASRFSQEQSANAIAGYLEDILPDRYGRLHFPDGILTSYYYKNEARARDLEEFVEHLLGTSYELKQSLALLSRTPNLENHLSTSSVRQYSSVVAQFLDLISHRVDLVTQRFENGQSPISGAFTEGNFFRNAVGLRDKEGPYTYMGIYSSFRWQHDASVRLTLEAESGAETVLSIRLSNLIPNQLLTICIDGEPMEPIPLQVTGWSSEVSFHLPLRLSVGTHTVEMYASKYEQVGSDRFYLVWRHINCE